MMAIVDVFGFLAITTTMTTGLTATPHLLWVLLLWSISNRIVKKRTNLVEHQWCNWFEVSKLVSALVGAAALNLFQIWGIYSHVTHLIISGILFINIAEAVLSDFMRSWRAFPNVVAGVILLGLIPDYVDVLGNVAKSNNLVIFPLDLRYILLYSTWNGAFSYGGNYSWSTRLMLVAPIATMMSYGNTHVWLGARCFSLILNMILRASETTRFYQPGKTVITHVRSSFVHNNNICLLWGCFNFVVGIWIYRTS
jgi:hypothetical protein